jgi:hypothetical protein
MLALSAGTALAATLGSCGEAAAPARSERGVVVLRVYDAAGRHLSWSAFRARQENGHGTRGDDDQLVDPASLSPIAANPLYDAGGDPGFDWPGRPAALTLAWPSRHGYDDLIVDVPGPGRHVFTVLAARQAVAALARARRAHPLARPGRRLTRLAAAAARDLRRAGRARGEARQGAWGARSLDAAQAAMVELLGAAGRAASTAGRQRAVTFDRAPRTDAPYRSVARLYGRDGWVRIVFDAGEPPSAYRDAVARAHRAGLRVTGELVDASDMARISLAAFGARVRRYVAELGDVDAWEVGNEVNARGLGRDVAAKVSYAADYVKAHTAARTLVTLYWQLGEDDARYSPFAWLDRHGDALREVDDVGLSVYPDQAPLGAALERVMTTLHERLPGRRLLISELGYAAPDSESTWWWGTRRGPTGAARRAVARFYSSAVMAYPFSGGGPYWWYFLEEARQGGALWRALGGRA